MDLRICPNSSHGKLGFCIFLYFYLCTLYHFVKKVPELMEDYFTSLVSAPTLNDSSEL